MTVEQRSNKGPILTDGVNPRNQNQSHPKIAGGVRQPFMFHYQVLGCFLTRVGCKVVAEPMQSR
jgi:hypothetical protein